MFWLRARLITSLLTLAILVVVGFLILDHAFRQTESTSHVINNSGRQRTLSVQLDALVTRLVVIDEPHQTASLVREAREVADRLERVHQGLLEGDAAMRLPASDSEAVRRLYTAPPFELDQRVGSYLAVVRALLDMVAADRTATAARLPALWAARDGLLEGLEALTKQFEVEAGRENEGLRWAARSAFALLLISLGGIWVFSFRPMELRIAREREALRGISENMADGIITIDESGLIRSFNPTAERQFGYREDEVLGRNVNLLMGQPDRDAHDGYIAAYRSTNRGKIIGQGPREVNGLHKDGQSVPLDLSISEMRVAGERLFIGVTRDTAARRKAAEDLRVSRERLRIFIRHTPAAIAMFDRDMRYIMHSDRWLADYGLPGSDLIGRSHYEVFPEIPDRWREIHARCLAGQVERCEEDPFLRRDGGIEWVRWEIHPWYESDGAVGGIIIFTEVITERKRAEKDLTLRNLAIEAASCGIVITDAQTTDNALIYVNPEFERTTGYAAAEALGQNCRFLQGEDTRQPGVAVLRAAVEKKRAVKVLLRNYRKDGTPFWNEASISPVLDGNGECVNFVGIMNDVTERIESEEALRRSEERFRSLYNDTPVMLHSIDAEGRLIAVSDFWLRAMGYARDEVLGHKSTEFLTEESRASAVAEVLPRFFRTGRIENIPYTFVRKDGTEFEVEMSAVASYDEAGRMVRSLAVIVDVTDRKRVEAELRQIQRMEAMGQLTGGIAHDFNNLLAVIMGNLQLAQRRAKGEERILQLVDNALGATQRGAELTQQLLVYARKQQLSPTVTDINELIRGLESLLGRTLGENIHISIKLDDDVKAVLIDRTQMESALINLAVNARDAMSNGGRLLIQTENIELDARYAETHIDVPPGDYLMIAVTDTGVGIPRDAQERIFEPFFTTKDVGKGTGLGLSMVYGFVKQSKGHIRVYSEEGQGTTFRIFLPHVEGEQDSAARSEAKAIEGANGETILVVEDERVVRDTQVMLLDEFGYKVIAAQDGAQALDILRTDQHIDLLFSDVVMPGGISGPQLAEMAVGLRPGLKVLLTSGYPRDAILDDGSKFDLLMKPSPDRVLLAKLRDLLGSDNAAKDQEP